MKEKDKEQPIDDSEKVKVKFKTTYIGKLGIYYKGKDYELPFKTYELLKNDCEKK